MSDAGHIEKGVKTDLLQGRGKEVHGPAIVQIGTKTKLLCIPTEKGNTVVIHNGEILDTVTRQKTIGRSEEADIKFHPNYDRTISPDQATIQPRRDGVFYIHDGFNSRGSTNGTKVSEVPTFENGKQIIPRRGFSEPFMLKDKPVDLDLNGYRIRIYKADNGDYITVTQDGHYSKFADAKSKNLMLTIGSAKGNGLMIKDKNLHSFHAKILFSHGVMIIANQNVHQGATLEAAANWKVDKNQSRQVADALRSAQNTPTSNRRNTPPFIRRSDLFGPNPDMQTPSRERRNTPPKINRRDLPPINPDVQKRVARKNTPPDNKPFIDFSKLFGPKDEKKKQTKERIRPIVPPNAAGVETMGQRSKMEDKHTIMPYLGGRQDRHFYGVYDGHGGSSSAWQASSRLHEHLARNLDQGLPYEQAVSNAYHEMDKAIINMAIQDGTTAVTALVDKDNLVVANVGDARAVLDRGGHAVRLSVDHKPSDPKEQARIRAAGHTVTHIGGSWRVNGNLAVARALGDREFKRSVIADPDVSITQLTSKDNKVILACDGVWDVISDQEATDLIRNIKDPKQASEVLKNEALRRGSTDNITVVVVDLKTY